MAETDNNEQRSYFEFGSVNQGGHVVGGKVHLNLDEIRDVLTQKSREPKFFKLYQFWAFAGFFRKHRTIAKPLKNKPDNRIKVKGSGMSDAAIRVLVGICCFADFASGMCDEPQGKLLDMFGLSKQGWANGVKELARLGIISYTPGNRYRSPKYTVNVPQLLEDSKVNPGGPKKTGEDTKVNPGGPGNLSGQPPFPRGDCKVNGGFPPLDTNIDDLLLDYSSDENYAILSADAKVISAKLVRYGMRLQAARGFAGIFDTYGKLDNVRQAIENTDAIEEVGGLTGSAAGYIYGMLRNCLTSQQEIKPSRLVLSGKYADKRACEADSLRKTERMAERQREAQKRFGDVDRWAEIRIEDIINH